MKGRIAFYIKKYSRWITILGYSLLASFFYYAQLQVKYAPITDARLIIKNPNALVQETALSHFIGIPQRIVGKRRRELNLATLEEQMLQHPYVKKAEIYYQNQTLNIEVCTRIPLVRLQKDTKAMYIDHDFVLLPLSEHFTANVPVIFLPPKVDLNREDTLFKTFLQYITPLLAFIQRYPFWRHTIAAVYWDRHWSATIYPTVGDYKVVFGKVERVEKKFAKWYGFMTTILPEVGWHYYRSIDLSYKDQIVAQKRSS